MLITFFFMSLHLFYLGLLNSNRSNLSIEHTLSFNGVLFFRCCLCINFTADMIEGEKQMMLLMEVNWKLNFNLK